MFLLGRGCWPANYSLQKIEAGSKPEIQQIFALTHPCSKLAILKHFFFFSSREGKNDLITCLLESPDFAVPVQ
jgi:hypothetical protein